MKHCMHNITSECGRDTRRPLEVHIKEYRHNVMCGLLERSRLAQHAYEEGYQICWKEAKVLQME
jgi:hypothetical protein